jgi:ribose/xylose/arabinose/galactoside ABC-type transport system permease subunit
MILVIIFTLVLFILLRYTPIGRSFYAIGENKINSYNAGLNVNRITYLSYILCSVMAVFAAIYVLGRFGGADPVLGPGMELEAIACVLIGGATLAGGRGSIAGTVCGVFVLGVIANLFSLMDINVWYQQVITGVMLLFIIASNETILRNKKIF